MKKQYSIFLITALLALLFSSCQKGDVYKTLIITGQGEHNWEYSSPVLKQILDGSGMFSAEILTAPAKGGDMSAFNPKFSKYKLVVLDYSGDSWSDATKAAFVEYVKNGGGVVVYHASCSAFPEWKEFNEMTGLGGFNGRDESAGPFVYVSRDGQVVVDDTTKGAAGTVAERNDFEVRTLNTEHPITKGLPVRWIQASDEMLGNLRGPGQNMEILATNSPRMQFRRSEAGAPGAGAPRVRPALPRFEPVLMAIKYGNGRIFNTLLGHADEGGGPAMQSVGFIATLQRGAEWAATGAVTQQVPYDFPTAAGPVLRPEFIPVTLDKAFEEIGSYDITKSTMYYTFIKSQIAKAGENEEALLDIEKKMVNVLKNPEATAEAKKLLLRELSWMGTDYCVQAIKDLSSDPELAESVEFALTRLQKVN
jgi:type 1 glutamine amidotransferase